MRRLLPDASEFVQIRRYVFCRLAKMPHLNHFKTTNFTRLHSGEIPLCRRVREPTLTTRLRLCRQAKRFGLDAGYELNLSSFTRSQTHRAILRAQKFWIAAIYAPNWRYPPFLKSMSSPKFNVRNKLHSPPSNFTALSAKPSFLARFLCIYPARNLSRFRARSLLPRRLLCQAAATAFSRLF